MNLEFFMKRLQEVGLAKDRGGILRNTGENRVLGRGGGAKIVDIFNMYSG